jgi:hypothetical protein
VLAVLALLGIGLSMVAHSAGVKINATSTDRAMAETMVIENLLDRSHRSSR